MEYRTKLNMFTRLVPILLCIVAVGGLVIGVQLATAQAPPPYNCIQDVWQAHGNNQNLTCTANDVRLSAVSNINVIAGGSCGIYNGVYKCICQKDADVTFTADFQMDLTADARYDVGFYIASDGDTTKYGALTGYCAANGDFVSNNTVNFINLDAIPGKTYQEGDVCGDITGPFGTEYNPQYVRAQVTMKCSPGEDGRVLMPWCTTWRQPGANGVCAGIGNGTTTNDLYPGSPSKCACDIKSIDIFSETASIDVTKEVISGGSVLETGGTDVTYKVSVKNNAQVSEVRLDSLTDNIYGNITQATPTNTKIKSTTCVPDGNKSTCEVCTDSVANCIATNATIAAGATCNCTFVVTAPAGNAGDKVTDWVTGCATDEYGHSGNPTDPTNTLCDKDDAYYQYTDVQEPPKLTKTASTPTNVKCSVDVRFDVVVENTSPNPPGDSLTLDSTAPLTDDVYGDITKDSTTTPANTKIKSTTCKDAIGKVLAWGESYSCYFIATVNCSDLDSNKQLKDTVKGLATDSDGVTYSGDNTSTFKDDAKVQIELNVTFP